MDLSYIFDALARLKVMIKSSVKRAYVSRSSDDSGPYNITQVSYNTPVKTANSEVINPYGLYTNLPDGIQVLLFSVCGDEGNRACIGYSQNDRFKNLKKGEVLLGHPGVKSFIKFDNEGNIEIESTKKITVKTSSDIDITCEGKVNITVTGDVDLKADNVKIDATKIDLGVGGEKIARKGDAVQVNTGTGTGTITGGGTNTSV